MAYRRGVTLRNLISPDRRARTAVLFVVAGALGGSLLTLAGTRLFSGGDEWQRTPRTAETSRAPRSRLCIRDSPFIPANRSDSAA